MSLAWFVAILVLIPMALLLLKRSGVGPGAVFKAPGGAPRLVASLPVGAQQRVLTVEVGEGADRRWLVLGVTGQSITPLHTLDQPPALADARAAAHPPFAQVLGRMLGRNSSPR
ncbi:MAG: flagellar biosynthetic protein FliO [Burkholderiales bacterium]